MQSRNSSQSQSYKFKIVLLGEGRVGKTSLLTRYVNNNFTERQESTIQASYLEKRINIGATSVTLAIWDTAGQERFHALAPIYYRDADGAVLVYDITDQASFNKVQHWVDELKKIVGENILLMIAANKQDLDSRRQVNEEKAKSYATLAQAKLIGTSAKTGVGVEEIFLELTRQLLNRNKSKNDNKTSTSEQLQRTRSRSSNIKIVEEVGSTTKKNNSCCLII